MNTEGRSNTPPCPYTVETLAELQARYPKALETIFDQDAIEFEAAIRPGQVAAQVFDFSDGLRLLVSRERLSGGAIQLHVSASFQNECKIADEFRLLKLTRPLHEVFALWAKSIPARFAELAQDSEPLRYIGTSDRGIPHWVREEV